MGKVQMQFVGILGLLSLVTLNNFYWVAALLVAAVPIPDLVTPLRQIAGGLLPKVAPPITSAPEPDPSDDASAPAKLSEETGTRSGEAE